MSLLWSLGWVIAGAWYAVLQRLARLRCRLHRQLRDDHRPLLARRPGSTGAGSTTRRPGRLAAATAARSRRAATPAAAIPSGGYPHGTMAEQPRRRPSRPGAATARKTGIPRNPGRHDLGMKATLLFPDREIVERYYVPLIYTACRTCYSELRAGRDLPPREAGEIDAGEDAEAHQRGHRVAATAARSSTSSSPSASPASAGPSRTSSSATGPASPSTSRASATSPSRARPRCCRGTIAEADPDLRDALRGAGRGLARRCTASCSRPASPARTPGSSSRTRPGRTSS